jgi:hypothetical protein
MPFATKRQAKKRLSLDPGLGGCAFLFEAWTFAVRVLAASPACICILLFDYVFIIGKIGARNILE